MGAEEVKPQPGKSGLVATLIAAASVVLTDTYKLAEARVLARAAAVDIDDGGEPKKAVDKVSVVVVAMLASMLREDIVRAIAVVLLGIQVPLTSFGWLRKIFEVIFNPNVDGGRSRGRVVGGKQFAFMTAYQIVWALALIPAALGRRFLRIIPDAVEMAWTVCFSLAYMLVMLIVVSEIIYQWQVWQAGDTKWKSKWGKRSPIMQLVGLQGTVYFPSLLLTPLFAIAWSIVFFGYLPLFRDKLPGYIATGSIMLYLFLALKSFRSMLTKGQAWSSFFFCTLQAAPMVPIAVRVLAPQLYKSRTMHVFAWLEGPLFVMAIVRQLFLYLGELYAERQMHVMSNADNLSAHRLVMGESWLLVNMDSVTGIRLYALLGGALVAGSHLLRVMLHQSLAKNPTEIYLGVVVLLMRFRAPKDVKHASPRTLAALGTFTWARLAYEIRRMYVAFRSVETDWVNMLVSNTTALILLKAYLHRFGVKDSIILAQTLAMCLGGLAVLYFLRALYEIRLGDLLRVTNRTLRIRITYAQSVLRTEALYAKYPVKGSFLMMLLLMSYVVVCFFQYPHIQAVTQKLAELADKNENMFAAEIEYLERYELFRLVRALFTVVLTIPSLQEAISWLILLFTFGSFVRLFVAMTPKTLKNVIQMAKHSTFDWELSEVIHNVAKLSLRFIVVVPAVVHSLRHKQLNFRLRSFQTLEDNLPGLAVLAVLASAMEMWLDAKARERRRAFMEALNAEAAKKKGGAKVPPKVDRDAIQGQFDDAFSALQTVLMVVHIMYYYQSGGNLLGVAVNMEVEPHKLHLGLPPVILATIGLLLILPVYYFVTSIHLRRFLPIDMRVTPTAKDLTPKVPAPGQPAAGANAAADGAAGGKQAGAEPGGAKKQGAGDSSKEGSWMGALGNVKGMLANPKDAITSLMTVAKDVGQQNLSKLAQGTTVMHPLDVATVRLSKAFINQNDTVLKWKQLYHRGTRNYKEICEFLGGEMTNNGKVLESAGDDEHAVGRMYGLVVEEIEEMKKELSRRGQSSLLRRIAQWKPSCIKTGGEGAESTEEKHIENMSNDEIERAMRGLKEAFLKWERQVIEVRYEIYRFIRLQEEVKKRRNTLLTSFFGYAAMCAIIILDDFLMSVAYHRIVPEVPTATWVKGVAMLGRLLSVGVALSSFAWWVNNIDVAATAAGATKEVDRIGDMARTLSDVGMVARGMLLPTGWWFPMMMLPFTDVDGTEVLFTGAIVKWTISFMVAPFGIVWNLAKLLFTDVTGIAIISVLVVGWLLLLLGRQIRDGFMFLWGYISRGPRGWAEGVADFTMMSFRSIKWVILKAFGLYTIAVRVVQHAVLLPFRLGIFLILSAFRLVTNILLGVYLAVRLVLASIGGAVWRVLPPATKASFGERGAALSASWGPVVGRVTARATSAWTWTSWAVLTAHAYLSKAFWFAFDLPITAPRLIWTGLVAGVKFVSQSRLGSGVLRGIVAAYRGVAWAVTTVLVNPLVKALDGIWFVVDKVGRFVGAVFYKIYETVLFRLRIYDAGKVVVLGVRFVLLKIWASIIWVFVNLNRLPLLVFRGASWGIAKVLAVVAWVVLGLLGPTGIVTRFLRMIGVTALANRAWRGLRHVALLPLSLFRRSAQSTSGFLGYLWKSPREQRRSPLVATILFIVRLPGTIIWTVVVRIPRAIVMGVVGGVRAVLSLLWHYTFGLVIHPAQPKGFLTHLAKLPKPRPKGTFLSELKRLPAPRLQLVRLAVNALTWPFRFVYKWTTRIVWTLLWPFRKGFSLLAAVARFFLSPVQRLLARLFAPVLGLFGGRGGSSGFLRDLKRLPGKKSSLLVRVVTAPFWGPVWLVKQLLYLVFLVLSSPFRLFAYLFGGVGGGGGAGAKAEGGMSLVTMLTMPLWGPLWLVKTLLVLLYKGIVFALVTLYKIVVFVLMIPIRVLAFPLRMIGLVR